MSAFGGKADIAAKLTRDEARRIAANIAKLPELLLSGKRCRPGARRRKGRAFPDTKLQRFWHGPCYVLHHKQGGCHDIGNDASRAHRKAARHQARKWLELETYLRRDRRHVARAHYWRHSWPNETNQAAGGQGCRIVRLEQDRAGAAQRGSASRFADAADRSVDLSLL